MTEPINQYVGDGVTVLYPFTFEYLEPSDIYVSVDQQLNTDWVQTSATEITFNTAPAIGLPINIFRSTDLDSMSAVFAAASTIRARDLNDDFNQLRLAIQEKVNGSTVIIEGLPELIQDNTDAIQVNANAIQVNANAIQVNADAIADLEAQDIVDQIVAGDNISVSPADGKGIVTINASAAPYDLPIASSSTLGGVKVGSNLSINGSGVLSADAASYDLPIASATVLGGIKVGANLTITGTGVLSATGGGGSSGIVVKGNADFTSTAPSNPVAGDLYLNDTVGTGAWAGFIGVPVGIDDRAFFNGADWDRLPGGGGGAVDSVNGKVGIVVLNAADVGAVAPGDDVSELNNDAGYITAADAAVQSVNGKVGIVVLNAADVGALPDTTTAADIGALPDTTTAADIGALPDTTSLDFVPLASWSSIPALP